MRSDTTVQYCPRAEWPAGGSWMTLGRRRTQIVGPSEWMGSLLENQRDASGKMYRRNRFYDPETGRFTQEDPIGLAGGLNLYGFANGDPVTYSDPYGLAAECPTCENKAMLDIQVQGVEQRTGRDVVNLLALTVIAAGGGLLAAEGGLALLARVGVGAAGSAEGTRRAIIDPGKIGYLFGQASGRAHNIARANQNALQMKRLGATPASMREHLSGVATRSGNVANTFTNQHGTYEVRESLYTGASGAFAKFQSTWEVMPDGARRLTTVIPFGGP